MPFTFFRSWAFKAVINATLAPTTPADIITNGVAVELVTVNGTVLDAIAYTSCHGKVVKDVLRRVDCKVKDQPGKFSLMYQMPKAGKRSPSNNATWKATGSWHKRALSGATAAAEMPLGVVVAVPEGSSFSAV